jgi:hypothetical protein
MIAVETWDLRTVDVSRCACEWIGGRPAFENVLSCSLAFREPLQVQRPALVAADPFAQALPAVAVAL